MASILKISEAASLALHTMFFLAVNPERKYSAKEIAAEFEVSEAHLSKVLQRLAKVDLVKSTRGPKGGFVLGKAPSKITLLNVYEAIDGPLRSSKCILGKQTCGRRECLLGDLLKTMTKQAREHLSQKRLSDLV